MIRRINDIAEYQAWLTDLVDDPCFSTPFCGRERIAAIAEKEDSLLLAAFEGQRLTGIFCLLVLEAEQYIETLFLYTRTRTAYEDLMAYLSEAYHGYEAWFVFNPKNHILTTYLSEKQAFFYTEQRYMSYQGGEQDDVCEIVPYSDAYRDEYIRLHSRDGYWDGEKVLAGIDGFHVLLCLKDGRPVGYIDLGKGNAVNEIMDLLILPEYRNHGLGALLLRKAIFINRGHRLILTVDIDNAPANHLYKKLGFVEIPANNAVTAKLVV